MELNDDGMQAGKSLEDLALSERWGADDEALRLFKKLCKEFGGKESDAYFQFPGSFRGTELHKAIMQKASSSVAAKTLLAIVMELQHVDRIGPTTGMGGLAEVDHAIELIRGIAAPILTEDLSVYAGWKGYHVPAEFELEPDYVKRSNKVMKYTADWIFEKLADDPDMQHYVEVIVRNEMMNSAFGLEEGVI